MQRLAFRGTIQPGTKEFATGASIQWRDFDQTDTIVSGLTLTSVGHWFGSSGSKDHVRNQQLPVYPTIH